MLLVGPHDERGYHPIKTIFQSISLADRVILEEAAEDSFTSSVPLPLENTVTRAWSLVRELVRVPPLRVQLEKQIPSQSGLGGGSADAAGFLRGVRELTGRVLTFEQLREIGIAVGADVPFLIEGGRAVGEGYGEKLTFLPSLASRPIVIAKPLVDCSTPAMYAALDSISRATELEGRDGNDFELVAPKACLDLIEEMRSLGAEKSALTGSGSAVFGYFASEAVARIAHKSLDANWKALAQTISC